MDNPCLSLSTPSEFCRMRTALTTRIVREQVDHKHQEVGVAVIHRLRNENTRLQQHDVISLVHTTPKHVGRFYPRGYTVFAFQ